MAENAVEIFLQLRLPAAHKIRHIFHMVSTVNTIAMLTKKQKPVPGLSVVQKPSIVIEMKAVVALHVKKASSIVLPPLDRFNTGYIKQRNNDPL